MLEPQSKYLDPLECFAESSVERTVEKIFSLETVGILEDSVSDYDRVKIDAFRSSITFRDGCYFVDLPWNENKLSEVPSNHQVALSVLDRVVTKLEKQKLYDDYCKVFFDQESEGIIERINVSPDDFKKYIWVPHRPVIKKDPISTTKIRPVFNCSLRTGGKPSLNDCVYPGINLFTDMWELLLRFRCNRYVLLADVRKAFLMIGLNKERDRNCFCFFVKIKEKLVCFRYRTLIFGFVASPFILNFIIKYHVQKYCVNPCTDMLLTHLYVDNLVKTHNSAETVVSLYREAVEIMQEGNFTLRSCNSNSEVVRTHIIEDGNFVVQPMIKFWATSMTLSRI